MAEARRSISSALRPPKQTLARPSSSADSGLPEVMYLSRATITRESMVTDVDVVKALMSASLVPGTAEKLKKEDREALLGGTIRSTCLNLARLSQMFEQDKQYGSELSATREALERAEAGLKAADEALQKKDADLASLQTELEEAKKEASEARARQAAAEEASAEASAASDSVRASLREAKEELEVKATELQSLREVQRSAGELAVRDFMASPAYKNAVMLSALPIMAEAQKDMWRKALALLARLHPEVDTSGWAMPLDDVEPAATSAEADPSRDAA